MNRSLLYCLLRRCTLVFLLVIPAVLGATPAAAGDAQLLRILRTSLPRVVAAERRAAAGAGRPEAVQVQYDAARDMEEALRAAAPVSPPCRGLMETAMQLARAEVRQAEGVDRPAPTMRRRGLAEARSARGTLRRLHFTCSPGSSPPSPRSAELSSPRSGDAFFGLVTAHTPAGAAFANIFVSGRRIARTAIHHGVLRYRLRLPPGSYTIKVNFVYAPNRVAGSATARDVWLLPQSAKRAASARIPDRALSGRLAGLARSFNGYSAMWVQDLSSGRSGKWNADARFPAASTVKLAVLIAALRKFGPRPERSVVAYDLRALVGWSSNLASNRLLVAIGGSEAGGSAIAQAVLNALGAHSSTFTGDYRIGTAFRPFDPRNRPPLISSRVTTARDLGRILYQLHTAALGKKPGLRMTGLSQHEARIALGLLLRSEPAGDNLGLFRPTLGKTFPLAQKNGWFSAVRHTAAILYSTDGPRIAVLLTYRPGLTRLEAARLGAKLVNLALAT